MGNVKKMGYGRSGGNGEVYDFPNFLLLGAGKMGNG